MVERWTLRFGGFGGQGIVLSSVVIGLAAVYDGKYVCQRASYGAEARGGSCRSEVIISDEEISYPLIEHLKVLVIMSQQAFERYLQELEPGGLLLLDPAMVKDAVKRSDIVTMRIPAAETADRLGNRIVANMVMLGALQAKTGIVSRESLKRSITDSVSARFVDIDLRAMEEGVKMMKTMNKEPRTAGGGSC